MSHTKAADSLYTASWRSSTGRRRGDDLDRRDCHSLDDWCEWGRCRRSRGARAWTFKKDQQLSHKRSVFNANWGKKEQLYQAAYLQLKADKLRSRSPLNSLECSPSLPGSTAYHLASVKGLCRGGLTSYPISLCKQQKGLLIVPGVELLGWLVIVILTVLIWVLFTFTTCKLEHQDMTGYWNHLG